MKEQIISRPTAELAKEVGFDIITKEVYKPTTHPNLELYNETKWKLWGDYCFAPTQSLLQKWIREIHNIHINITTISVYQGDTVKFGGYRVYIASNIPNIEYEINSDKYYNDSFDTYEEALEDALFETLKIIKTDKLNNK